MEKLDEFWSIVVDVWGNGVWGIDIGRFIEAIGIVLLFVVFRHVFTRLVIARIRRWTDRSETDIDDRILMALENPIRFIPLVLGLFIAVDYLALHGTAAVITDNIVRSLIAFAIFWALHNAILPISIMLRRLERVVSPALAEWLVKAMRVAIILVGGATVLEIWGIEVAPIIAGMGLLGVAVALGAQDLFKNLIAGILILAEKRFFPGQWIRVDGTVEGTVETIGFRSTRIRRFDQAPVFVPNAKLADNALINFSNMTHRRIYWMIGVEYRTSVQQLRQIRDRIEDHILTDGSFCPPEQAPLFVRIDRFSDSSIDIMLYCFTRTKNWGEWLRIKEALAYRIKDIIDEAGTGFAFPSTSLYVEQIAGDRPESFVPPRSATPARQHPTPPRPEA